MKRQLIVRVEAEAGFAEAVNFYQAHSQSSKQRFIETVEEVFDLLLDSPRLYAVWAKEIRRVNIPKFPYALGSRSSRTLTH